MSLPSIRVSLPLLFVGWCAGAYFAGMWPLLVYPALWAALSLGLFVGVRVASAATGDTTEGYSGS
ncbi:MAG: hypothetical protein AAF790_11720 [Planctomycetota bacterium]